MIEIESKMRVASIEPVIAALRRLGAVEGPRIEEVNWFFDRPDRSMRQAGEGLRIRSETHSDRDAPLIVVTHKGPRAAGPLKVRAETEMRVDDAEGARSMLEALGFVRTLQFEKRRHRWRYDDCLVELDTLPHLGEFVEVEGPGEQIVQDVCGRLGLDEPQVTDSYAELIDHWLIDQGITESDEKILRFP